MKKTSLIISVIFLIACGSPKLLSLNNKDVEKADKKFPGITLAELNEGKLIFETNCGRCHPLEKSLNKSEESLRKVVPSMARKSKIDVKSEDLVLKYLITVNSKI
jgi:hypothetical protein